MKFELSFEQTRVLGVFLEKEQTTPDQYPLSTNAITTACNQKTNREPVVNFAETDVQNIVDELLKMNLLCDANDCTARVKKYRHRLCGSQFAALKITVQEAAILCVLFLRGPQTPGELRTRTQRLTNFTDVEQVEACLNELSSREDGPFVIKLAREAGKRESRYAHLFSGEVDMQTIIQAPILANSHTSGLKDAERITELEHKVEYLTQELLKIKQAFDLE